MRMILTLVAAAVGAATLGAAALAAGPVPFPAAELSPVFVVANTVTTSGAASNYFAPGATVVFRANAVDRKTHEVLTTKKVKFFYVAIPGTSNVKLKYDPKAPGATTQEPWTGTWTVPASYPTGIVGFKVLVKTSAKRVGSFVQMPVSSAQLTVTATPPAYPVGAPAAVTAAASTKQDVSLYVDSVNGSRPAAAAPRPVGCTQTNVYHRGEQLVLRSWGTDVASGAVLSNDNVDGAVAAIPGQPDLKLNWSAHGATGSQIYFWSGAWNIPTDYPLGDATIKVTFKTTSGKVGTYSYGISIIP